MTTDSKKPWQPKTPPPPVCQHPSLVPLEFTYGKVTFSKPPDPYSKVVVWDEWNIVACHRARVVKYYCPACKEVIPISTTYKGKEKE